MKKRFLFFMMMVSQMMPAQDSLQVAPAQDTVQMLNNNISILDDKTRSYFRWKSEKVTRNDSIKIFSLSPISRRVNRVNGFALGVGHYENEKIKFQKVNGLNIEASPISLALISVGLNIPFEGLVVGINDNSISNTAYMDDDYPTYIQINGLNISSGGFMGGAKMNGLNISVLTAMNQMNGLSLNASLISTKKFNGLSIAGIANISDHGNGIQIAPSNVCRNHRGIQIGLFNHSKNLRGIQIGLWNTNGKRKLPFFNWQTKK
ncbi:LA_2272 family surface repeat-containing protein [Flavobacterium pedocola]